jgi:hypothetical protein
MHAATRHIVHHRLADEYRKACRKCRARHCDFTVQRGHRPLVRRCAMDQPQRPTDLAVAQRADPSCVCSRVMMNPRSDRLNHQNVGETGNDRLSAGTQDRGGTKRDLRAEAARAPLSRRADGAALRLRIGESLGNRRAGVSGRPAGVPIRGVLTGGFRLVSEQADGGACLMPARAACADRATTRRDRVCVPVRGRAAISCRPDQFRASADVR